MIWILPLTWSAHQNVLKKSYQKEDQNQLERKEWLLTEIHLSFRRLLMYTSSFIYALFNPKVYGRVFKKSSYQFISKFDTFQHKLHCHIRFNVLHLFKYSIDLFFRNFRARVGGGIYSRKVKLSQIFIQNSFELTRYRMSPIRNRVTSVYRKAKIANYSL